MTKLLKLFSVALCVLLLAGMLGGCGGSDALSVTTVKTKSADRDANTDYYGTIHAAVSMAVIPNVMGKVEKVDVTLGQVVNAGDVLMKLDTADAALLLKQAQASLDSAQANYEKISTASNKQAEAQARQTLTAAQNELRDANTNYDTVKSQYDSGSLVAPAQATYDSAKSEYDRLSFLVSMGEESNYTLKYAQNSLNTATAQLQNAKASALTAMNSADSRRKNANSALNTAQENYALTVTSVNPENIKAAKASLETAKVSVEIAQKRIDDSVIKAPIHGAVSIINVKAGDIDGQQTEAFHILSGDSMEVDVNVTEGAAAKLTTGLSATVTLTGNGETCAGTVSEVSPMADTKTGMYLVKLVLTEVDKLRDGMQATVRFAGDDDGSVLVPQKSIVEKEGKHFVYLVKDGKATSAEVTLGNQQGAYVVVNGLETGAEVILQGADKATAGATVHIIANANS